MDEVSLVKEDGKMIVKWQMPVETLIAYRHILAKCASILKCSEDQVLNKVEEMINLRNDRLKELAERAKRIPNE